MGRDHVTVVIFPRPSALTCGTKSNDSMDEVAIGATGCMVFDKVENVWQLKWPPVTHPVSNWQLTS